MRLATYAFAMLRMTGPVLNGNIAEYDEKERKTMKPKQLGPGKGEIEGRNYFLSGSCLLMDFARCKARTFRTT